jgi:hypothetical protein
MTDVSASILPKPPSFTEEEIRKCRETGDYAPVLFEWYKFVGSLCILVGHVKRESPALRPMAPVQFHILIGLLNRCARLMLANIALSHRGQFGETTSIIDRCIFESALKIIWLCTEHSDEKFSRYLADGLRTELEFKAKIEGNIAARNGSALPIETRMLSSIAKHIAASGLLEGEITAAKKLPDLTSMIDNLGFDRLLYVVGQRIGSHHVHATWSSLLIHYLEEIDGGEGYEFAPRGHASRTHINQYIFVSFVVLEAMAAYVHYAFGEPIDASAVDSLISSTRVEIERLNELTGEDI